MIVRTKRDLGKHKLIRIAFYAYHQTMKFLEAEERRLAYTLLYINLDKQAINHSVLQTLRYSIVVRRKATVGKVRRLCLQMRRCARRARARWWLAL